mgnify:CR=1 FL=1|jgi:hypothetical protein
MRLSTQRGGVALPTEPPADPLPEPDDLPSVPPEPTPPPRPPPTEPPPGTDYEPPEPFSDDDDFGDAPLVATAIPFATRVSGRIDREQDLDCFSFPVRKNYKYRIRVYARSLDNPLVLLVDGSAEPKTLARITRPRS